VTPQEIFLQERLSGIGGSDVHSVLSLEPYGCARFLWYQKKGYQADYASDGEAVFERGHTLEPIVANKYAIVTGRALTVWKEAIRRTDHPELLVHVDRMIESPEMPGPGVLEIKTASREVFFKLKREGLPQAYICQLQYAMHVTGCQWGAFAVLWPDAWKLLHWDERADTDLQSQIALECIDFWEKFILGNAEPERLEAKDKRCQRCVYRTSCQGKALLEACGEDNGDVAFDAALTDLASAYIEMRDIAAEADALKEDAADALKKALGDRTAVECSGARIYLRPQTSMRLDGKVAISEYDRLRKWAMSVLDAHPELWDKSHQFGHEYQDSSTFRKPSVIRPLRVFAQ
jgi:predicted phage-related endonuclease